MRSKAPHICHYLYIALILLCTVLCRMTAAPTEGDSAQTKGAVVLTYETDATSCASLSEKKADIPHSIHEMQLCGMPATPASLQGTTGRTFTLSQVLQRVNRTHSSLITSSPTCTYEQPSTLYHTISAKLFRCGYYIYYRCQMRC